MLIRIYANWKYGHVRKQVHSAEYKLSDDKEQFTANLNCTLLDSVKVGKGLSRTEKNESCQNYFVSSCMGYKQS